MFIKVSTEIQIAIIESLAKEIWTEHYIPIIGEEQVDYMLDRFQTRQAISEQIASGFLYFLIEGDDQFIGYLSVQPQHDALFLSKLYVRTCERGKGHGRKAILFIEKLAREKGLGRVLLTVNKNNRRAINAYERTGFKNLGSVVQDIGGGFIMDDYKMEKIVLHRLQSGRADAGTGRAE
ncbi:MAG TPA: GNAT family N-acetyltransferase [Thermodesulfovibrionales bacterium]|nr:GNAT family N-acetyltransferase [Thermodesulfovibrionales bacterium]